MLTLSRDWHLLLNQKMYTFKKYIHELLYLVGKDKNKLPFFAFLFLFSSLLDVVGLGLIVPYIQLITSPDNMSQGYLFEIQEIIFLYFPNSSAINTLGVILFSAFLFKSIIGIYIEKRLITFGERQRSYLKSKLMWAYQHMEYLDFLSKNTSYYINLINTSTYYHASAVRTILKLISNSIVIVAISILLILSNPLTYLFILLSLVTLVTVYSSFLKNKIVESSKLSQIYSENTIKAINEGMLGYKEIRIFGKEKFFYNKVRENCHNDANVSSEYQTLMMIPRYVLELIVVMFLVISVMILTQLEANLQLFAPTFALFGVAAMRLLPMVNFFSEGINRLRYSRHYVSLLYNDVSKLRKYKFIKETENSENRNPFINLTIKNTTFYYPNTKNHIINDISLTIKSGEAIGIIGPSGSGKTTLINMILGLIKPQSGTISYNSSPLENSISKWHKHIAYLPQDIFISDDSIRANVAFGIEDSMIDNTHVYRSLKKASLGSLVEQLPDGINTMLGENGMRLSGGQRQRVVLARAFYHERDVLIMDESTSSLDRETEQEVVNEIRKLKGSITLIVIAHRMSLLKYCDRIYSLDKGKIIDKGDYKHIARNTLSEENS